MTDDFTGNLIEELAGLKARFAKEKKGFRQAKYGVLEEVMAVVVELRMDPNKAKEFGKLINVAESKMRGESKDWITLAAVELVMPGKGSWKAARALDYLHDDEGIPLDELADKFQEFGGIEKIAKKAARERPRRSKERHQPEKETIAAVKRAKPAGIPVISKVTCGKPDGNKPALATSTISVSISSALLERLKLVEVGRRIKLVGARQKDDDWTDSMLKIRKLILPKE